MTHFKYRSLCRVCSEELDDLISLEPQYLSPTFVKSNVNNELSKIKIPLTMSICKNSLCSLVQLRETTDPNLLYTNYFYRSSTNLMMLESLKKVVAKSQTFVSLKKDDIVVVLSKREQLKEVEDIFRITS